MSERHTREMLKELQSYPLEFKIKLTKQRIREWINEFGVDGVFISFSGGKDSTVLLDIIRQEYPEVPAVFVDTGLEFSEIRQFVRTFDNVTWLKPKKNFRQVIEDYGYPFISKEVAGRVYFAQKYLREHSGQDNGCACQISKQKADEILLNFIDTGSKGTYKIKELYGKKMGADGKTPSKRYNFKRYTWLVTCPHMISDKCCTIMKNRQSINIGKRREEKQ